MLLEKKVVWRLENYYFITKSMLYCYEDIFSFLKWVQHIFSHSFIFKTATRFFFFIENLIL